MCQVASYTLLCKCCLAESRLLKDAGSAHIQGLVIMQGTSKQSCLVSMQFMPCKRHVCSKFKTLVQLICKGPSEMQDSSLTHICPVHASQMKILLDLAQISGPSNIQDSLLTHFCVDHALAQLSQTVICQMQN